MEHKEMVGILRNLVKCMKHDRNDMETDALDMAIDKLLSPQCGVATISMDAVEPVKNPIVQLIFQTSGYDGCATTFPNIRLIEVELPWYLIRENFHLMGMVEPNG